jgi:FKBP-type peptidyl-prolyl cis-trans isomerase (trigger factor)
MTREEIEKRMDELARKYVETHDREIIEELNRLSRQLQELEKHFRRLKVSFWINQQNPLSYQGKMSDR